MMVTMDYNMKAKIIDFKYNNGLYWSYYSNYFEYLPHFDTLTDERDVSNLVTKMEIWWSGDKEDIYNT